MHSHLAGRSTYGRPCIDGALWELAPLLAFRIGVKNSAGPPPDITDADFLMKAYSIASYAYQLKYHWQVTPERQRAAEDDAESYPLPAGLRVEDATLDCLVRAADYANMAACMQFVSPAVLYAAVMFRDLAEYLGLNVWKGIKRYAPLLFALEWADWHKYEAQSLVWKRLNSREFVPAQAVCLAPDCNQSPEREKDRQWCRGYCSRYMKPWYCSEKCRKKVRLCRRESPVPFSLRLIGLGESPPVLHAASASRRLHAPVLRDGG